MPSVVSNQQARNRGLTPMLPCAHLVDYNLLVAAVPRCVLCALCVEQSTSSESRSDPDASNLLVAAVLRCVLCGEK